MQTTVFGVRVTLSSDDAVMNLGVLVGLLLFCFLGFLFATYVVSLRRRPRNLPRIWFPPISIVIPAHDEERDIVACLRSVAEARYPGRREIVVVDDGSTDRTAALVREFALGCGLCDVALVQQPAQGKADALNSGVQLAKHGILITIDADVRIGRETLVALVAPLENAAVGATNAIALIERPRGFLGHAQAVEYALNNLIRTSFSRVFGASVWFAGMVAAYRREALDGDAPFKKRSLAEDWDACLELFRKGYRVVTCEDAAVSTRACATAGELVRQRMRWYFGALQTLGLHRKGLWPQAPVPIAFLYVNQWWWTLFSFVFFPLTAYQVWFWWPHRDALAAAAYLSRWFSLAGPAYVLAKIPAWGVSFLNLFGVLSGVLTLLLTAGALARFRVKVTAGTLLAILCYFPYTMLMNVSIVAGVLRYRRGGRPYFKA
jgi:cellulose synthase/poly-beta-1,6-N-acetylglucosamine synthase-like glycosyltransferase